jgi:starch phosphorylase
MEARTAMDTTQLSAALTELALDLRWAWNHAADDLWRQLDSDLWASTGNAWFVLQTVSKEKLQAAGADAEFQRKLAALFEERRQRAEAPRWFQQTYPKPPLSAIAYFSLEFMLSDALPIYSGGLGNVAGDQLKSAGDLGVPVIGVGLLYQQGYFRQHIDAQGRQQALYPFNDPSQLPITPIRQPNGDWLSITMDLPGFNLRVRTWQVQVGRTKLYLLDTNDPANLPEYRGITSELYGGESRTRLQQERVLGVAGWRLLRALGIKPEVCHLNEGHAAFAVLERARGYMEDHGQPFDTALSVTRAGNVFTTHTPVEAGFDRFPPDLMEAHMKQYAERELGIPFPQLLALGRKNPNDRNEPFNMAYLAVRGSGAVNGVSRLHGEVSRRIFQDLFPQWPQAEVPVGHVTNGVHVATWDSPAADELWTNACGKGRWRGDLNALEEALRRVPATDLWTMRTKARKALVDYVRQRLARQLAGHGASPEETQAVERYFDADSLTIGFARRFATYKRPNLLLHDPDRLLRILTNPQRPVQLILAGKAHPRDAAGQEMIRQWVQFIRETPARSQAVFLSDYDMSMTEHLVQGVDLWLNTPRRPWEASGTSGMKVLVNGGLNLSELDGWWAEAYTAETGWAIGDGLEHDEDPAWDAAEAERLYTLLEQEIVPAFYRRDEAGVSPDWVAKMRESMARLTPEFSANRTVRQYTGDYYLPAAKAVRERSKENGAAGTAILNWQHHVADHWSRLRLDDLKVDSDGNRHVFHVRAWLDEADPAAVRVELYAEARSGGEPVRVSPVRVQMERGDPLIGSTNAYTFTASVPADRPASDFTPRLVAFHPGALVPLEANQILWYP